MTESTSFAVVGVAATLGVVAIIGAIVFGTYQAQVLGTEVKLSCIENGGTWVDYNSLCIAEGGEVVE